MKGARVVIVLPLVIATMASCDATASKPCQGPGGTQPFSATAISRTMALAARSAPLFW